MWPRKRRISFPVSASQRIDVRSLPPESTWRPSGETATPQTIPLCPSSLRTFWPVSTSQTRIAESVPSCQMSPMNPAAGGVGPAAIGGEGHTEDAFGMTLELADQIARFEIPEPDHRVRATREGAAAVGSEGDANNPLRVLPEPVDRRPVSRPRGSSSCPRSRTGGDVHPRRWLDSIRWLRRGQGTGRPRRWGAPLRVGGQTDPAPGESLCSWHGYPAQSRLRLADRASRGWSLEHPPRYTRLKPSAGPIGSSAVTHRSIPGGANPSTTPRRSHACHTARNHSAVSGPPREFADSELPSNHPYAPNSTGLSPNEKRVAVDAFARQAYSHSASVGKR